MFSPTFAPSVRFDRPIRRLPRRAVAAIQFALLFAFAIGGTAFLGLALAAPVASPIVERTSGAGLSAADLGPARRLGTIWWLFAAAAVVSFAATLRIIGMLLQHLAPAGDDH